MLPCLFVFIDNESPVLSNRPSSISVNTASGQASAIVTWAEPTASDNSGFYTITSSHSSGSSFSIGITTVTYTVVDGAGNAVTYSFNITVTGMDFCFPFLIFLHAYLLEID